MHPTPTAARHHKLIAALAMVVKPQVVRAIAFGTVATRKWSPFRSPAFGRVSTIAGDVLIVAIILLFIALPALFAGV